MQTRLLFKKEKMGLNSARRSSIAPGMKGGEAIEELVQNRGLAKKRLKKAGKKLAGLIRRKKQMV